MRVSGSIRTKLIASTVAVLAAIIAVTTIHSRGRQLDMMVASQQRRLAIYSGMVSLQVRSAVAFADHATSTEVLDSLKVDPDVAAVVLFGDGGTRLYEHGAPSAWVAQAAAGVISERNVSRGDRYAVVTPVQSLEGPRGTLVIEMSTDRITAHGRAVTRTAITAGAIALVMGILAVWLITRPMLRRLRRMSEVAKSVGSDAHVQVEIETDDELGALGTAFNAMVEQLRAEQHRLREAIAQLQDSERRLEQRVERRTESLKTMNGQLRNEMERRAEMEIELRQAQKLESVGRLASGVAHEINTPVQFVSDSCSFLQNATQDLMSVIVSNRGMRDLVATGMPVEEALASIRKSEEDADVDYLLEQIPLAIERSLQGLERVATIVKSMKEFAHPDQSSAAFADLNRAITSTITVARNEYKYVADLETELGELPMVSCHIGELNQVVLNIVVNAAHAIEASVKDTDRRGKITIRTSERDQHAVIEIVDDGCGIPQTIIDKIFDPFFTTKEIGKGTGQGLAIARSVIVDKHHGKLTVDSEPGCGTTFRIWLPIAGEARQELALAS
jgi:signal transduction histidine kinase